MKGQWIEIERTSPPPHKRVIVWAPDVYSQQTDGQDGLWDVAEIDSAGVWSVLFEPTHWRPLPKRPSRPTPAASVYRLAKELVKELKT